MLTIESTAFAVSGRQDPRSGTDIAIQLYKGVDLERISKSHSCCGCRFRLGRSRGGDRSGSKCGEELPWDSPWTRSGIVLLDHAVPSFPRCCQLKHTDAASPSNRTVLDSCPSFSMLRRGPPVGPVCPVGTRCGADLLNIGYILLYDRQSAQRNRVIRFLSLDKGVGCASVRGVHGIIARRRRGVYLNRRPSGR